MKTIFLIIIFLIASLIGNAQNIGISDNTAFSPSFMLHLQPSASYASDLFSIQNNTGTYYFHVKLNGQTCANTNTPVMSNDVLTGYANSASLAWGTAGYHVGTNGGGGFFQIIGPTNGYNAGESWTNGTGCAFLIANSNTGATNIIGLWAQTGAGDNRYGIYSPDRNLGLTWTLISDGRLKKNTQPVNSVMSLIKLLEPITYEFDTTLSKSGRLEYGFTSQNLEAVFPALVYKNAVYDPTIKVTPKSKILQENFKYDAVNYIGLIAILVKGMQEQQSEIDRLKVEIEILKCE